METGDEADGQEALLIHLPAQEEVALQVVQAEVVLTAEGRETAEHMLNIIVRQVSARKKTIKRRPIRKWIRNNMKGSCLLAQQLPFPDILIHTEVTKSKTSAD